MRVLILGGDGYLGWPTAIYLSRKGHDVAVVDNYFRRLACHQLDAEPLIPVPNLNQRARLWNEKTGLTIQVAIGDICDYVFLCKCFTGEAFGIKEEWIPEAIVHYAEQPSAPYSMMDHEKAIFTIQNNLLGTANIIHAVNKFNPDCHIIKLGTMGVYGTPNIDIEEGYLDVEYKGRKHTFLYPKTPGSLYHLTKAQDGDLLYFYARMWNIRVSDLNQGPVYGLVTDESKHDEKLITIFNYDDIFGTVLNRFLVQAVIGHPLTVYGKGGQTRGYIDIRDTIACIELALLNPAQAGEYRVFNQITETFSVKELANKIVEAARDLGLTVKIKAIKNPRKEAEKHYYNPKYSGLKDLGLTPHLLTQDKLKTMLEFVSRHQSLIHKRYIMPRVTWG